MPGLRRRLGAGSRWSRWYVCRWRRDRLVLVAVQVNGTHNNGSNQVDVNQRSPQNDRLHRNLQIGHLVIGRLPVVQS